MNKILKEKIENVLSQKEKKDIKIIKTNTLSGGSINQVIELSLNNSYKLVLKYNFTASVDFFLAEARGLEELKKQDFIEVPSVIYVHKDETAKLPQFLLMEYISSVKKKSNFYEDFGKSLALMHKIKADYYGFYEDNYIGLTRQSNKKDSNWVEFFRKERLYYQIDLARSNNLWNDKFDKLWSSLEKRLGDIIYSDFPSLLHGDLWSGNYIVSSNGSACFIDPAVYYGSNEADLAMTELFGGYPNEFYLGYREIIPTQNGYENRKKIYNLYHLINHLNLFGSSYASSVHNILSYFGK